VSRVFHPALRVEKLVSASEVLAEAAGRCHHSSTVPQIMAELEGFYLLEAGEWTLSL
jgi:hypothetical protein